MSDADIEEEDLEEKVMRSTTKSKKMMAEGEKKKRVRKVREKAETDDEEAPTSKHRRVTKVGQH
jgi:hypothetical protein